MTNTPSAEVRVAALSNDQRTLLKLLLEQKSRREQEITPVRREAVGNMVQMPASVAQQRLWFVDKLAGGHRGYIIPAISLRLCGRLDREALQRALDTLAQRHEVLRTSIVSTETGPVQQIVPLVRFPVRWIDLSSAPEEEREGMVRSHEMEETQELFDLANGPLARARVLCTLPNTHVLLITMHHLIADGWSIRLFAKELAELYRAFVQGESDPLRPLSIQYGDYAQWQRKQLQSDALNRQVDYWRERLKGAPAQLDLPTDRVRPAVQSTRGANVRIVLDAEITGRVKLFAQKNNITFFMALYGALAILLSRLSGQSDIVIGTPIANRQRPEFEQVLGLFVNTLALRADVCEELSLREFLRQIRCVTVGAYEHQDVPLERVVEACQPERSLSRAPLFQVMFVLHNEPRSELRLPGLSVTPEDDVDESSILDLWMSLEERGGELTGTVNYAADLFERATIEEWIRYYERVLRAMVREPEQAVGCVPLLTEAEQRAVIDAINGPEEQHCGEDLLHECFERQAARTPLAVAISFQGLSLTYRELNERANRLADFLRSHGLGSGQRVGLCLERGLDMVVALIGVLKAGAAYVPLDPQNPVERLAYILEDSAPEFLITQDAYESKFAVQAGRVICLEREADRIAACDPEDISARRTGARADDVAYVIYTSGSTGRPKGVMVEHRNVTRLFTATHRWFRFDECDVWTLFHSFAFDFSVWEIWGALLYGGRLVVVPQLTTRSPRKFHELLCDEGVTILNQTPSAFSLLIEAQAQIETRSHSLRLVIFGGEALEPRALRPWVKRNGAERPLLINMYGITETTVHVTYRALTEAEIFNDRGSPIGQPIPDARLYLLDAYRQPVPVGVAGEIYVAGAGVARGYLNRNELTAERFVADPFRGTPGGRMYKSGDRGRWRFDGTFEYLGRNDDQVKIRGFRIELGEIEGQILLHSRVRHAAVALREDTPGDKRLVAYVVAMDAGSPPNAEELREHLKAVLPEHMIPAAFVVLAILPLTANGKLDRRGLQAPERTAYASRTFEAPEGLNEELLARIWQDLLGVDRVGRHDHFFELGGHSLLIVQMLEKLRRVGLSADVRQIFETPILMDLGARLECHLPGHSSVPPNCIPPKCQKITPAMLPLVELEQSQIDVIAHAVPGGAGNIQDIYPLSPLQEGILFHHLWNPDEADPYSRSKLFSLSSNARLGEFIVALQRVVDRHDILRTAVLWERLPRAVQVVFRRAPLVVDTLSLDADTDVLDHLRQLMKSDQLRLDLRKAPMMCVQTAVDATNGKCYALLLTHHLVCDAESQDILIAEVMAHLNGRAHELDEAVPYRNHVAQAMERSRSQDAEAFFRARLGDVDEPTVPFGLLEVHGSGRRISMVQQTLDAELARNIRLRARDLGVGAATVFHATWALVLARVSGRDDVVFGSVLLGRLQGSAGAQRILGMFINTLPLRLRLDSISAKELIEHTHAQLIELLGHEQASLALAQRCSRVPSGTPLFSALLNYRRSTPSSDTSWSGAAGVEVISSQGVTNYPLLLSVDDTGECFVLEMEADRRISVQHMIGYVTTVLQSLVHALQEGGGTAALELHVLPGSERDKILHEFNGCRQRFADRCVTSELFESQVERTPDAAAVVFEQHVMTYAELNAAANCLAHFLRERGVGPDMLVGLYVERGFEMVIGILGVLKAGGAYVPLDPSYPADRLEYMLADAAPKVLLIQERLRERLSQSACEVVALDSEWERVSREPCTNPDYTEQGLNARNLAYVIYTSGSTGRPKGAMNEHRALINRLQWMQDQYRLTGADGVLQKTPFSFDVSVWEFIWTLMSGARLIVARPQGHQDPMYLRHLIETMGVTTLHFVPSMLQVFLDQYEPGWCPSIQHIVCSGEALPRALQNKCLQCLPQAQLSNLYGPTEAAIDVTAWECMVNEGGTSVPIGRPIWNTQMYVLDRRYQPVPIGVAGEIYIGGAGVGRGYLHRRDLTAERFLPDLFGSDRQARFYKTGDMGRWRPDGSIEYMGRNDHQVKIRGSRIELGEIEAQLVRCEGIREALVVAREDVRGEKRLVAYAVAAAPSGSVRAPSVDAMRAHLKAVLPEYMVPSAFVMLPRFPLNANGKLDQRALPAPDVDAFMSRRYEPPQGEVEQQMASIWQSLLRLERVSRHDSFFELGGHSLNGITLIGRVAEHFEVHLSIALLFQHPTIGQMALLVESLLLANASAQLPALAEAEEGVL